MSSSSKFWNVQDAIPVHVRAQLEALRTSPALKAVPAGTDSLFAFLHILRLLKSTPRTGWLNHGISHPESVADHMYRMGIISMVSKDKDLDSAQCIKLALVHDMAEAVVGDITPFDPVTKEEKHLREYMTMKYLTETVLEGFNKEAAVEIMGLWLEYENISSSEAQFVKDVDKFELMMQTIEYENQFDGEKDLNQFLGVRKQIKSEEVSGWADAAIALRNEAWDNMQKQKQKQKQE